MPQITEATLTALLAERFPDLDFAPKSDTRTLLRHVLAYARARDAAGRSADVARVLATVEEIITSADYAIQDVMIVELIGSIDDPGMIERFGPASKKWRNYHLRQREAER